MSTVTERAESFAVLWSRMRPEYRFIDGQTGAPRAPFGHHFPWNADNDPRPNTCAMCGKGPKELSVPGAASCEFPWFTERLPQP